MSSLTSVTLPNGRETSCLGLGTAGLGGVDDRRKIAALLDRAFELGIRHYDTAPMYGNGLMEREVGEFIKRCDGHVTIGTKFGLRPALDLSAGSIGLKARAMLQAKRWVKKLPIVGSFAKRLVHASPQAGDSPSGGDYSLASAEDGLARSLDFLGLEQIDLFFAHEGGGDVLRDEALQDWVSGKKDSGAIGNFGLASYAHQLADLDQDDWSAVDVLQIDSDADSRNAQPHIARGQFVVAHSVLSPLAELCSDQGCSRSEGAALLLRSALEENPSGITLLGTTSIDHLTAAVEVAKGHHSEELVG